jgi:hypothetical protein
MSSRNPSIIDLDALQNRLDDLTDQPRADSVTPTGNSGIAVPAAQTATNGNGQSRNIEPGAESEATLPVPQLGAEAAENMTKLSKAAAADIRRLGLLAFKAGKQVQEECEQMASDVEANGGTVALHLTGLSQLLADVGISNRDTLHRLSGGASPSIVPPSGNGHAAEQPAGPAQATRTAPLSKARSVRMSNFLGRG